MKEAGSGSPPCAITLLLLVATVALQLLCREPPALVARRAPRVDDGSVAPRGLGKRVVKA